MFFLYAALIIFASLSSTERSLDAASSNTVVMQRSCNLGYVKYMKRKVSTTVRATAEFESWSSFRNNSLLVAYNFWLDSCSGKQFYNYQSSVLAQNLWQKSTLKGLKDWQLIFHLYWSKHCWDVSAKICLSMLIFDWLLSVQAVSSIGFCWGNLVLRKNAEQWKNFAR